MSFTERAPAKLNLFLHITGRRADGYHTLQSLAVFTELSDQLRVESSASLSVHTEGEFAAEISGDNLVLRAAQACGAEDVAFTLQKNIPVGAGLGGGSADAAAALRMLARMGKVDAADNSAIARALGSDVPACFESTPVYMEGAGERLTPAAMPFSLHMVLVNPRVPLATAAMYARIAPPYRAPVILPAGFSSMYELVEWLMPLYNDFLPHAAAALPVISEMLAALEGQAGCLLARLSGSGPTCFGLFSGAAAARAAAARISTVAPAWWVRYTSSYADQTQ